MANDVQQREGAEDLVMGVKIYVSDYGEAVIPEGSPMDSDALWTKSGRLDRRATQRNKAARDQLRELEAFLAARYMVATDDRDTR